LLEHPKFNLWETYVRWDQQYGAFRRLYIRIALDAW
jgi:hypothetical protein